MLYRMLLNQMVHYLKLNYLMKLQQYLRKQYFRPLLHQLLFEPMINHSMGMKDSRLMNLHLLRNLWILLLLFQSFDLQLLKRNCLLYFGLFEVRMHHLKKLLTIILKLMVDQTLRVRLKVGLLVVMEWLSLMISHLLLGLWSNRYLISFEIAEILVYQYQ